jgi:hypothetical protein
VVVVEITKVDEVELVEDVDDVEEVDEVEVVDDCRVVEVLVDVLVVLVEVLDVEVDVLVVLLVVLDVLVDVLVVVVGLGGANPWTCTTWLPPPKVEKRKSPVTGSVTAPSAPVRPVMNGARVLAIGSPFASIV